MNKIVWIFRYLVFPALLALVILAIIGGFLAYRENQLQGFLDAVPSGNSGSDDSVVETEMPLVTPVDLPPAVAVGSYAPGSEYPLAEWETLDDPAGFVDWITVNGELLGLDEMISVGPGDVIGIGGWAGHRLLGMRFPEVLFSVCDMVFGGVPVDGIRDDIAESVHPNLLYSGWDAKLYAADLPDCSDTKLSVWGRPPVGATLRPIIGGRKFEKTGGSEKPDVAVIHTEPLVRPVDARIAAPKRVIVPNPGVVVRQCAGDACAVMANIPPGAMDIVVVEESDGWVLIQSAKGSGWIQARTIEEAP